MTEALEAISDGFALFDPDERLVLVNAKFRDLCGISSRHMVPGARYEDLLRASVEEGEAPGGAALAMEGYVQDRLFRFRYPGEPFEFQTADGRWVLVADHKAEDGSTVCIRTDITELKRRETDLRDSEGRYRQLVDISPDGIAVHDTRGVGRFINSAGRRILGVDEGDEPSRLHVLGFATEESRPLAEALMRRVVLNGETISQVRIRLRRVDGAEVTTDVSAVPFQSGGERLVLCLFRDVSGEAAAGLRLRESEARARSILDTALDAIVSIDADGRIIEFNPAAERAFGWKRAEVVGRDMASVLIPDRHRHLHESGMERLRVGGRPRALGRRIEVEAVRRDGSMFPVELAITEVPLGPGRRFTAYIRDITEQKRAQREIDDKTRILEAMMESVGVGIEVYDADGYLLIANQRLAELLDLPQELLKPGTRDRDVLRYLAEHGEYPEETVEQTMAGYDQIRAVGEFFSERRRPNGRWLQVRHFPMPAGGYVALFTDVTEQKNLEAQLLQSQKMDALGQLAGGVAHDFNNILSVIGGYATLAGTMLPENAPVQPHLAKIGQGVQRASALTRELLTFSRRKVAQARTVDLAAVVRNQEFLLKPLLGETIALTMNVPCQPVWSSVDPDMVAQALVNLAINARDAMPTGGPLAVALELPEEDGPAPHRPQELTGAAHAVLRVTDGGTGMSADVVARIFEPFYTTKPPGQGTGLGLSMVYGTMRQSGGAVEVESEPGQGTTFRLWFPSPPPRPARRKPPPSQTRPCRAAAPPPSWWRRMSPTCWRWCATRCWPTGTT
ncbi:PAS domain S-box protein [Indioceanicola profundi]|uniref:PAS domain S-box protein n=1 Tax=Indioceanicola profundi TaxID=2220096 RepID=UPI0013C515B8|nr:PAS domain S-box protein [Indioceanicola profundi]